MQQNDCDRQQFINELKKITSMALNKSTGNMYAFVSHTYNPFKDE